MFDWISGLNTFLLVLIFLVGLVLIIKGGDWFVDSASWIAEKSGIPKFIIGATIVSIATTIPELVASVVGTINGSIDMAIGNAVGSVTANTGLILAVSLIFMPGNADRKQIGFKSILLMIITATLLILSINGSISVWNSIVMILLFFLFIYENVKQAKVETNNEDIEKTKVKPTGKEITKNILLFILGATCIFFGAQFLINSGTEMAHKIGISEAIIGLTFVAIGTSLPELVTTITAIVKKQSSLSIGNIIGANIIDMSLILPICSFVNGNNLPVSLRTFTIDLPVSLGIMIIVFIPSLITKKFSKWQGITILTIYIGYIVSMAIIG